MQKYERHEIVHASQVLDSDFQPEHYSHDGRVPGLEYFPLGKYAIVRGTHKIVHVGGWVVRQPDGTLDVMPDYVFRKHYTRAASES